MKEGDVMIQEVWKPVVGYEGLYAVSNLGNVKSLSRISTYKAYGKVIERFHKGKILTQHFDGLNHYLHVQLSKNGKLKPINVHRIVANAFIENPHGYKEVNHKDENKTNNCVDNLEWCDHKYNNNYGTKKDRLHGINNPMAKLTPDKIRKIRQEFIPNDVKCGITGLSKKYGISITHIHQIVYRKRWGWLE